MAHPPELVWLDNLTPKSTRFDDTYYSRQNGLEETRYVFIDGNRLTARWHQGERPVIGELGFGTGLNFLATWHSFINRTSSPQPSHEDKLTQLSSSNPSPEDNDTARAERPRANLTFVSVEKYPMDTDSLAKALSPWIEVSSLAEELVASWQPDKTGWQQHNFGPVTLKLFIGDALDCLTSIPDPIDAWYLDGFNPKTNPELWALPLMQALHSASTQNATLASYTAAGWVRRNLQQAGFVIAKRKGFGHKRDMIIGHKAPPAR